jgi:hypothetical protein
LLTDHGRGLPAVRLSHIIHPSAATVKADFLLGLSWPEKLLKPFAAATGTHNKVFGHVGPHERRPVAIEEWGAVPDNDIYSEK